VSTDKVIKARCDKSAVTCPFTANTPKSCYRVKGTGATNKAVLDAPCGNPVQSGGVALVAKTQDIMVKADAATPTTPTPASCQGNWLHVTFNDVDGYTLDTDTKTFDCNGDGWLKQVGPFTVIRNDHSRDTNGASLTGEMSTAPNKFLLHTIEGAWPSKGDYPNGNLDSHKFWPNFIVARQPDGTVAVAQYFSMYSSSRALGSHNNAGIVQVEIGARADNPFTEHDWVIALVVRELYHAVAAYTGIPLCVDSRVKFIDNHTPQSRLSDSDLTDVHGLLGHQHILNEDHWDPGMVDPFKLTL